jgi:hypothetical protein
VATLLYTALADLEVSSAVASWPCKAGNTLPLDPARQSTINLLAAGKITLAGPGAVDTATPANIVRGQIGLHKAVSN